MTFDAARLPARVYVVFIDDASLDASERFEVYDSVDEARAAIAEIDHARERAFGPFPIPDDDPAF